MDPLEIATSALKNIAHLYGGLKAGGLAQQALNEIARTQPEPNLFRDLDAVIQAGKAEVEARVGKSMHHVGFIAGLSHWDHVYVQDEKYNLIKKYKGTRAEACDAIFGPEAHLDSAGGVWR